MMGRFHYIIAALIIPVFLSAVEVKLPLADGTVAADISEDKGAVSVITVEFLPVTTLDAVSNEDMTLVMAQFFAEEALSVYRKTPVGINFVRSEVKSSIAQDGRCRAVFRVPPEAVVKAEVVETEDVSLKEVFAPASVKEQMREFRSECFRDLRVAEIIFLQKIRDCKEPELLRKQIDDAFDVLDKKITADYALFRAEKADLKKRAAMVKTSLISELDGKRTIPEKAAEPENYAHLVKKMRVLDEFKPFLLSDPVLLEIGGCRAFEDGNGNVYLIAVGRAEVKDDSAFDRLTRTRTAEARAFAELAKHDNVAVTFFASRLRETDIIHKNGRESSNVNKKSTSVTTVKAETYLEDMITAGQWYSPDGKMFFIAKGCVVKGKK